MIEESRKLSPAEEDAFGKELDVLRDEAFGSLGQADVDHIRGVVRLARRAEAGGRALLHLGLDPVTFLAGAGALGVSKILENMEIGHNVIHGQYDWTKDPALEGAGYEWDIVCPAEGWRRSHNFEHHTFTNILGKDRDVGYLVLRVSADQPWHPAYLLQPVSAVLLALMFEWGLGLHDMRFDDLFRARSLGEAREALKGLVERGRPFLSKAARLCAKDYLLFPALALANAPRVLAGNVLANVIRNVWGFSVIFCGHFPAGVRVYAEEACEGESRGAWYARQLNGSANIEGGKLLHLMTGHLSHQIEHHLFPDLPAARYPGLAPKVRAICERYGQRYSTGSMPRQLASVARQILRNAFPGGGKPIRDIAAENPPLGRMSAAAA